MISPAPRVHPHTSGRNSQPRFSAVAILCSMPRVSASFQCRNGWYVQFLECDLKTPLRRTVTFASEDKLIEMDERGKADLNLESRAAIQHGIEIGKGGFYLNLTAEQYRLAIVEGRGTAYDLPLLRCQ